jgi:uncharacterized protein (UPF0371 family)
MIETDEVGVPKGEGREQIDTDITLISSESLEEVFELLEDSMNHAETHLSHEEVRPSGYIMATNAKKAYRTLVEAHPDYELNKND